MYGIQRDAFSKLDEVERLDRLKKGFWRELHGQIKVLEKDLEKNLQSI
jgi:hypothetical protein